MVWRSDGLGAGEDWEKRRGHSRKRALAKARRWVWNGWNLWAEREPGR